MGRERECPLQRTETVEAGAGRREGGCPLQGTATVEKAGGKGGRCPFQRAVTAAGVGGREEGCPFQRTARAAGAGGVEMDSPWRTGMVARTVGGEPERPLSRTGLMVEHAVTGEEGTGEMAGEKKERVLAREWETQQGKVREKVWEEEMERATERGRGMSEEWISRYQEMEVGPIRTHTS